ncbi:MAG TPA: ABC transporter ATP-binding protein [Opitutaceae bacterium]|nr:ABC transporter ATP-binding protein [Opitutaceae bacterium]HND61533.1 ABC transporter ATP-binding protein [Opitutaceae bacterium]
MRALDVHQVSVPGRLEPVTLELGPGQLAGVVGPNGSGKSTLLQVMGGLLPHTGEVKWHGRPLPRVPLIERGRTTAWVPQEAHFEFGFSVRAVVAQGRFAHGDDEVGVDAALARFDLAKVADRPVDQLSGGEKHRVLLARALATGASIHLWDEPLAALDPRHSLEVLQLGRELTHAGATLVFSLHDLRVATCLDVVVVLHAGRLRAVGPPEAVLTPELLREVFGVQARQETGLTLFLP